MDRQERQQVFRKIFELEKEGYDVHVITIEGEATIFVQGAQLARADDAFMKKCTQLAESSHVALSGHLNSANPDGITVVHGHQRDVLRFSEYDRCEFVNDPPK